MTAVDERVETIEHLDFEAPCEDETCEKPADFSLHCRFCASVRLRCASCFNDCLDRARDGRQWECIYCQVVASAFFELISVQPLKRFL